MEEQKTLFHREKYKGHILFSNLEKYSNFYDRFSDLIMSRSFMGFSWKIYMTVSKTLQSCLLLLKSGAINNAYALLRNLHDLLVIDIYAIVREKEKRSSETLVDEQIKTWLDGKGKLPRYGGMSNFIKKTKKLEPLTELLNKDNRYEKIRTQCNDRIHFNSYSDILIDYPDYLERAINRLNYYNTILQDVLVWHLSHIFFFKPLYMATSDLEDCIECGLKPPEGCEYWVASLIQDIFDTLLVPKRPDIAMFIAENCDMQLDLATIKATVGN